MNQNLIELVNGVLVVSSRKVAENFGKEHKNVIAKISEISNEIQPAEKSARYFIPSEYTDTKGENRKEFLLSRDGFSLIVMGFTGTKALQWKMKYIEAFNKMEAQIAQINIKGNLLLSIYNGGQDAVVAARELTKLEVEQATTPLIATIAEQQPAVDFARHVTESSDSVDIGEFSKIINNEKIRIGRNDLFKWLRNNKYLMKNNTPYQRYIDNGYFEVIEAVRHTPYGNKIFAKTLVKGKGQIAIVERLRKEIA